MTKPLRVPSREDMHVEWADHLLVFVCPCDWDDETEEDRSIHLRTDPYSWSEPVQCPKCKRTYQAFPIVTVSVTCDGKEIADL